MSTTASTHPQFGAERRGARAMLQAIGLDPNSEAVYRALLAEPRTDVARLAARLDLTAEDVLASLRTLAEMSLVSSEVSETSPPLPVRPQIGLTAVLLRQRAELLGQQRAVTEGRAAVAQFLAQFPETGGSAGNERLELLVGPDEVRARMAQLVAGVEREVRSFSRNLGADELEWTDPTALFRDALGAGAVLRTVYPGRADDAALMRMAQALVELGVEIKVAPMLQVQLTLLDSRIAVLPLEPAEGLASGAVVIRDHSVLYALTALFEQVWSQAYPLTGGAGPDEQGLTRRERILLRLLMTGMTDEAAGKRLGMSLRSVRRMMSDLMERLEARGRFAAGARAQAYGWLSELD